MNALSFRVERWTPVARMAIWAIAIVVALLTLAPFLLAGGVLDRLTILFVYILMAAMWNALAGYGGLVSIGQQMFFALGAYFTIRIANAGVDPLVATVASTIGVALVAWVTSLFMLRLNGGEFAIGMWVLAELTHLLINLDRLIQGETGTSLISINSYDPTTRHILVYLIALVATLILLAALLAFLRSKSGAAMQAIRDNEVAAQSVGVEIVATKRKLFVLAAVGTGLAGAIWLCTAITFQPKTYFGVQWTAYMIFMVLVGGIGTFEGTILGALVFFVIETWFGGTGVWYLIGLGLSAVLFSLFFPRGIWGWLARRFNLSLLPVGYRLNLAAALRNGGDHP